MTWTCLSIFSLLVIIDGIIYFHSQHLYSPEYPHNQPLVKKYPEFYSNFGSITGLTDGPNFTCPKYLEFSETMRLFEVEQREEGINILKLSKLMYKLMATNRKQEEVWMWWTKGEFHHTTNCRSLNCSQGELRSSHRKNSSIMSFVNLEGPLPGLWM